MSEFFVGLKHIPWAHAITLAAAATIRPNPWMIFIASRTYVLCTSILTFSEGTIQTKALVILRKRRLKSLFPILLE